MKLHWALGSQPGRSVKAVMDIGKIPCTYQHVDIMKRDQRTAEYLHMYPVGKIPVLQDGNFTLGQSPAIMTYLCELYPHIHYLIGSTIQQRAIINQFVSWYQSTFRLALFKPIRLYLGAVFTQQPIKHQHKASLFDNMHATIQQFDSLLSKINTPFIAGDQLSIADLLFYFQMTNLVYFNLEQRSYPSVSKWYMQVEKTPSVKAITEQWSSIAKSLSDLFREVEIIDAKL